MITAAFINTPPAGEMAKEILPWFLFIPKAMYLMIRPHWKPFVVILIIFLLLIYARHKLDKRNFNRYRAREKEELADVIAEGIKRSK